MIGRMTYALGQGTGPLRGVKVVEVAGIGPGPHACMLLADLGADVVRIDRPGGGAFSTGEHDVLNRGRPSVALDLKHPDAVTTVLDLVESADVLVEGMRPGTLERLGLGPDECLARNPRLVYARMTGWGQDGPLASRAGHDINYIAVAGLLEPIGRAGERPHAPMNVLGDFAGGGMLMAMGVVAALYERERSGFGQVVDAAMVDGASLYTAFLRGMAANGLWEGARGTNILDGGAPFYDTYATADGGHLAVGCVEPQFFVEMLGRLGIDADELPFQLDATGWSQLRKVLAERFAERTRDEWVAVFEGSDACVSPVLAPSEAHLHPHHVARRAFVEVDGLVQPAPAPRFSRTVNADPRPIDDGGRDPARTLGDWGVPDSDAAALVADGTVS